MFFPVAQSFSPANLLALPASLIHMRLLVPSIAALVPLLITPGTLAYFDVTPKIAFLLIGTALILLYRAENTRNITAILSSKPGRWWIAVLAAQWLSSALATALSTHPELSLNGGNWRRLGLLSETGVLLFVLFAAAWLAADRNNLRTLLRACTAAGVVAALYGIAQYFGFDPLLPVKAYQAGEGPFTIVRPPGTLGHADYFGAWLVIIAFMSLALERLEHNQWMRFVALSTSALVVFAIILSGTRSAILGLLLGAMVFLIAGRPRIRARAVGLSLASLAALAMFFFSPPGAKLRARLHWSLDDVRGGARLLLWRDSLRMAAHRPIQGFGPETFVTEFPRFESVELARAYPDFYHESPHNIFLDPLTSRGVIGLLPFVALCGLGAWAAFLLVRRRDLLAAPLAGALVAALVCQLFMVFIVPTALYFYLLLAILVALATPTTAQQTSRARWYPPAAFAAAILLTVFAVRLLVADAALAVADRRLAAGDVTSAAQAYRTVLKWQPSGAGSDLRYSHAMQQLAARAPLFASSLMARQEALKAAIDATRTSEDRANAWYNLANLFAATNDPASVEHSLRNAIAWAPNWFKPHWTLAQLLELENRHNQALSEAAQAAQLDAGHDPEVTETWKHLLSSQPAP
jgi:putative inorganic carbon (HCO3(-)) transporter